MKAHSWFYWRAIWFSSSRKMLHKVLLKPSCYWSTIGGGVSFLKNGILSILEYRYVLGSIRPQTCKSIFIRQSLEKRKYVTSTILFELLSYLTFASKLWPLWWRIEPPLKPEMTASFRIRKQHAAECVIFTTRQSNAKLRLILAKGRRRTSCIAYWWPLNPGK